MYKVLVVDDEAKMRKMVCDYLNATGYICIEASNGIEAIDQTMSETPDLIIMDIMMPGLDGVDAMRRIRERSHLPIIMLTARSEETDKLIGLEMGADDYITKPFSLKELGARVRSQLRRVEYYHTPESSTLEDRAITRGVITMDVEKMVVKKENRVVNLTAVQFSILKLLMSHPGRVFKRDELLGAFQEDIYEGYERTVDVHVKNIRKVLEEDPAHPIYLETVWGVGYKFSDREG